MVRIEHPDGHAEPVSLLWSKMLYNSHEVRLVLAHPVGGISSLIEQDYLWCENRKAGPRSHNGLREATTDPRVTSEDEVASRRFIEEDFDVPRGVIGIAGVDLVHRQLDELPCTPRDPPAALNLPKTPAARLEVRLDLKLVLAQDRHIHVFVLSGQALEEQVQSPPAAERPGEPGLSEEVGHSCYCAATRRLCHQTAARQEESEQGILR